uniref:Uncharacterized protein n=1 Tax=Sphaerodactylus townsendi TaxID=933632 RepID=A0ACB8FPF1_9SAUR
MKPDKNVDREAIGVSVDPATQRFGPAEPYTSETSAAPDISPQLTSQAPQTKNYYNLVSFTSLTKQSTYSENTTNKKKADVNNVNIFNHEVLRKVDDCF